MSKIPEVIQNLDRESKVRKILILGIQNAGKSALIYVLMKESLDSVFSLLPTRGYNINLISFHKQKYFLWDLGGVLNYRLKYLIKKDVVFSMIDEFIFLIDVQEISNYKESIHYLSKIIRILEEFMSYDFKLNIFLHKADPELMNSAQIIRNIEYLTEKIESIQMLFNYTIAITSIFCFQKNQLKSLLTDKNISNFSSLLVNLFSCNEVFKNRQVLDN